MMKLVRPSVSLFIAFWIRISVRVSTLEVASSRIIIFGLEMMVRAMVKSCFWPWLTLVPSSLRTVS